MDLSGSRYRVFTCLEFSLKGTNGSSPSNWSPASTVFHPSWEPSIYWETLLHYLLRGDDIRTLLLIVVVQNRRQVKTRWNRGQQEKKIDREVKRHTPVHTRNSSKIRIGFQDFWNSTQNCAVRGYFGLLSGDVGKTNPAHSPLQKSIMFMWVIFIKLKNWSIELWSQKWYLLSQKKQPPKVI